MDPVLKRLLSLFLLCLCLLSCLAPAALAAKASPTSSLLVNGKAQAVSAFKVAGTHYFKLRDVAAALSDSDKPFDVAWSDAEQTVSILPGQVYDPSTAPEDAPEPDFSAAYLTQASILLEGERFSLEAYSVQDHYYFKLRDVLALLDIGVFWDGRQNLVKIDTAYHYLPADHDFKPQGNIVILMYHDFTEEDQVPPEKADVVTTAAKFEADIRALLEAGYLPLCMEDLYLNRFQAAEKYFVLTCDDGYLSNYKIAYPILQKLQVPMDIFINTDNVDLPHHFSLAQAAEMEASGLVKVYSHFPQHLPLPDLDPAALPGELRRSIDTLESALAPKHFYFFAYPHGAYNAAAYQAVEAAGFQLQLAQNYDPALPHMLVRVNVSFQSDVLALAERAHKN